MWEYQAIKIKIDLFRVGSQLTNWSNDDWELVTVDQGIAYFKRQREEDKIVIEDSEDQILIRREDLTSLLVEKIEFDFPVRRIVILDDYKWPATTGKPLEPSYKIFNAAKE